MANKKKNQDSKKISKLRETLIKGNSLEKERAMEQVISNPSKEIVEMVAELLYLKETVVRMFAVDILKKIGGYSMETVLRLLDDPDEDIQIYACEILGGMKEREAIPYLIKKLKDEKVNVRNLACIALGEIGDEYAVDALFNALKDDEWVEFSAVQSLGKIGGQKVIKPLLNIFSEGKDVISPIACEALIDFRDKEILDRVIKVLKSWDKGKRGEYIKIILEREDEELFYIMQENMGNELFEHLLFLVESDEKKSIKTLRLISYFKNTVAAEVILDAFKYISPDSDDYQENLSLFAGMSDVWAKHIESFLQKEEDCILAFIKACGMAGIRIDEELLFNIFVKSHLEVKRELIRNLPSIVKGNGYSIIKEAVEDPDGHIRGDAMAVIGTLGALEFKERVIEIAKKDYLDIRQKAMKALLRLDYGSFKMLVEDFVKKGSTEDKRLYISIAPFIKQDDNYPYIKILLSDADNTVRKGAIGVMGRFLDHDRYMELFKGLLKDDNVPHEALKIIKDRRLDIFKDRLIGIFSNKNNDMWTRYYALLALGSFEDRSLFDTLIKGLDDENNIIKIGSLKALSSLNDERSLEFIRPYLNSEDEDLRTAAESVLERFTDYQAQE
ncbi:MAG: HEAT repeat domain-containing protein [Syntrophorhabdaceae bacterium]|nr:HEAT repeat domain-containing protein [Syntrophorhabdaceae bacterium]